jgi:hypothetical protein
MRQLQELVITGQWAKAVEMTVRRADQPQCVSLLSFAALLLQC